MNEAICDKIAFETRGMAGQQITHMKSARRHTYSTYRCTNCGMWHITTSSKSAMKRDRTWKYPLKLEDVIPVYRHIEKLKKKLKR